MSSHIGEFAALLTTVFWTITALSFETASKRIGSMHVNLLRLGLATVFLTVFSYFHRGLFLPLDADAHTWTWLAISGLVGFVIGDFCLFKAFTITGARVAMLMMTLAPVFAAFAAWIILGEVMSVKSLMAMLITLTGIALVIFTRTPEPSTDTKKIRNSYSMSYPVKGIILGVVAAAGQGVGLVLSKYGMRNFDPFAASQIRVITGFTGFAILFFVLGKWKELPVSFRDTKAMKWLAVGSFFGPFLGVSFSLMAVQHTNAGIAQTIMSLVPVLIIPPAVLFNKEKVTIREITGAVIAVAGVALFFI
ncbi:MAG: DMT family transporter [Bacteroidota bacterium]